MAESWDDAAAEQPQRQQQNYASGFSRPPAASAHSSTERSILTTRNIPRGVEAAWGP